MKKLLRTRPFTVFAPTDEAFAKLPAGALDALIANPEQLRAVLTYHVVSGRVMAADVMSRVRRSRTPYKAILCASVWRVERCASMMPRSWLLT